MGDRNGLTARHKALRSEPDCYRQAFTSAGGLDVCEAPTLGSDRGGFWCYPDRPRDQTVRVDLAAESDRKGVPRVVLRCV